MLDKVRYGHSFREEEESVVAPRSTRPKRKSLTKYGSVLSHFYFILITAKHLG